MVLIAVNCPAEEEKIERVVKSLSFDPKTAVASYELTHPAKVRVRMGTKDGPLFRTITDWQERGIGRHSENWDGMDATGKVKLVDNYVVNVLIQPIVQFVLIFLKLDIKKLKIMSATVTKGIS